MNTDKHGFKFAVGLCLAAFLIAGCQTDKPKDAIVFTDDATIPKADTNSVALALLKKNSLLPADERRIDQMVFSSLLSRHFWDDGGYTAIFLQADDDMVAALQKTFHDRKPPIKETYRADVQPNMTPRDKDTGQPAMILSVDVSDPEPDGSVIAIGKWYAGGAVAGFYSYQLAKNGNDWVIQNTP